MHKYILILFIFLALGPSKAIGQKAYIEESPEITQMMRSWIANNKGSQSIRGWRIQIITTDDRRKMDEARGKFAGLYPEIQMKWEHESPYYKVQIGAYEKKMDLQAFLLELKDEFRMAIPVMDDIRKTELVAY